MRWRMIGPFRGGRTVGAVGVPNQPNVFYIGVNNGGVWKTDDYCRTWKPIFDDQPTGSIGTVAIASSNPDILYVGPALPTQYKCSFRRNNCPAPRPTTRWHGT